MIVRFLLPVVLLALLSTSLNAQPCQSDTIPPEVACLTLALGIAPTGTAFLNGESLTVNSSDNCTAEEDLKLGIELTDADDSTPLGENIVDHIYFGCDQLGVHFVRLWVEDEAGNTDYCVTTVAIQDVDDRCPDLTNCFEQDVNSLVDGCVETICGDEFTDVYFVDYLFSVDPLQFDALFNVEGHCYCLPELIANPFTYTRFSPDTDRLMDGVSTLDIILVRQHILGISTFEFWWQYVAADVSNNNSVSTFDIINIRQRILNTVSEFPGGSDWTFWTQSWPPDHPGPLMPDSNGIMPQPYVSLTDASLDTTINWYGIPVGNLNACPDGFRSGREVTLEKKSSSGDIQIRVTGKSKTLGFQMAFQYDPDQVIIESVTETPALAENAGQFYYATDEQEGVVRISYTQPYGMSLSPGQLLFTIRTDQYQDLNSDLFMPDESALSSEWYSTDQSISRINWVNDAVTNQEITIYPNPFNQTLTLDLGASMVASGSLTLYHTNGQCLFFNDFSLNDGRLDIQIPENIPSGMLLYRIVVNEEIVQGKLLKL